MKSHFTAIFLLILFCGIISDSVHAKELSPEQSKYLKVFGIADGIRHSVWQLDDDTDPIAQTLNDCLSVDGSTVGMDGCLIQAIDSYEALLDKLIKLSGKDFTENQNKWLAIKNDDQEIINNMSKENHGSLWGPIVGWHKIAILRQRIADISFYLGGGEE